MKLVTGMVDYLFWNMQEVNKWGKARWLCQCDCGVEKIIVVSSLRNGDSQSCGCLRKENIVERCKGTHHSEETCKKISEANSNPSDETRKKLSESAKVRFENSENHPMFGVHRFGKDAPGYKHGLCGTKEYQRASCRKRRALKHNAEGTHTITDLKYIYDHQKGICGKCREYIPFEKMTVDHIIPLTWGGSNYASNIQLLCKPCNCSKGNHNDIDYRDYIPLFLE